MTKPISGWGDDVRLPLHWSPQGSRQRPFPREDPSRDDRDLHRHTDFRRGDAALLERGLGRPAAPIVGPGFEPPDLDAPAPA